MTQDALAKAGNLLDGTAIDGIASWADDYRRDQTSPQGQCVIAQTERFLSALKDLEAKAEASRLSWRWNYSWRRLA